MGTHSKKRNFIMRYIFFLLIIFLFVGRTEINDVFPYVHVEYPFRGLFVVVGIMLIAYYSNQIKF